MSHEKVQAFSAFFSVLDDDEFTQYVSLNKKIISNT